MFYTLILLTPILLKCLQNYKTVKKMWKKKKTCYLSFYPVRDQLRVGDFMKTGFLWLFQFPNPSQSFTDSPCYLPILPAPSPCPSFLTQSRTSSWALTFYWNWCVARQGLSSFILGVEWQWGERIRWVQPLLWGSGLEWVNTVNSDPLKNGSVIIALAPIHEMANGLHPI